jgi:hypothetical protein
MPSKWKRISQYCIECDGFYISKYKITDDERFVLFQGVNLLKVYKTAQEAKDEAMALIQTESSKSSSLFDRVTKQGQQAVGYDRGK